MPLKSILNRVQRHQSFVYGTIRLVQKAAQLILEIQIQARKGSKAILDAGCQGQVMTHCRAAALNLCPCGASQSSFSMP